LNFVVDPLVTIDTTKIKKKLNVFYSSSPAAADSCAFFVAGL